MAAAALAAAEAAGIWLTGNEVKGRETMNDGRRGRNVEERESVGSIKLKRDKVIARLTYGHPSKTTPYQD